MRLSKDDYYLNIAKAVSMRSSCLRRQYGCVIVKNDEIIATGYNGAPRGEPNCCDVYQECPRKNSPHNVSTYNDCHSVHAEQNALLSASRDKLIGSTAYLYGAENGKQITAIPCLICERMLKNAAVARIVCSQDEEEKEIPNFHQYRGYEGSVAYDTADKVFYGEVIGTEDSLGYHAQSLEDLEQSFHRCVDHYLDVFQPLFKTS